MKFCDVGEKGKQQLKLIWGKYEANEWVIDIK
jgi:hypothetical protein